MVLDSSALVAILSREPDADTFAAAVLAAPARLVGAPSYLETVMVLVDRLGPAARGAVDQLISGMGMEVVPFTPDQARSATEAFLRYGKGRHPAGLNFGNCCSYALVAESGLPLLFKGDDFSHTDIGSALARKVNAPAPPRPLRP